MLSTQLAHSDSSKHVTRSRIDESTSNLVRQANTCDPSTSAAIPVLSSFDRGHFQYLIAAWSARHAHPFVIIEDEELHEIFIMLYLAVEIHSSQMMSCDISNMYERSRTTVAQHLQLVKYRLHLTLDGWTSPNIFSFLGVTVQYLDQGNIHSFVLDFVKYDHISYSVFSL